MSPGSRRPAKLGESEALSERVCPTGAGGTLLQAQWCYMPYRRPEQPPQSDLTCLGVRVCNQEPWCDVSATTRMRSTPRRTCTAYLYHRLYAGGALNGLYRTADGHDTILLHKEYPTVARYHRADGKLVESEEGRRRGAFDICVWDPAYIAGREHRKQKVLCAAELALNETRRGSSHTVNDATKLAGKANEIKYGVSVVLRAG